jgi:hypothetical protein
MNIPIFLDKVPKEYMQITKKTTVKSVRKFLEKYKFNKIEFLVNDKTESKIFNTDKYDNFDLSSIWSQLKNPAIYLTSSSLISSTLTDTLSEFKLEILEKDGPILLEMGDDLLEVGQKGRKINEKDIFNFFEDIKQVLNENENKIFKGVEKHPINGKYFFWKWE